MSGQLETKVLQALRLKGRASPADIAAATGEEEGTVTPVLSDLVARGLAVEKNERTRLTPEGRQRLDSVLDAERAGLDADALEQVHDAFIDLNGRFKQLASDWQQRAEGTESALLAQLEEVHAALAPLLDRLAGIVPRTGHYLPRFEGALAKLRSGDHSWLLKPLADSYHTVWFELHEELIGLTGRTRLAEAAAGRAQ